MKPQGRPKKKRIVEKTPEILQFSPRGKPGRPDEIELFIDELEAIKQADFYGKYHAKAAQAMGISRPSFGRILKAARKKVADALVSGKIIRISLQGPQ